MAFLMVFKESIPIASKHWLKEYELYRNKYSQFNKHISETKKTVNNNEIKEHFIKFLIKTDGSDLDKLLYDCL